MSRFDRILKQGQVYPPESPYARGRQCFSGVGVAIICDGEGSLPERVSRYYRREHPHHLQGWFMTLPEPPFATEVLNEANCLLANALTFLRHTIDHGSITRLPFLLRCIAMFHPDLAVRLKAGGYLAMCHEFDCSMPQGPYFSTFGYEDYCCDDCFDADSWLEHQAWCEKMDLLDKQVGTQ